MGTHPDLIRAIRMGREFHDRELLPLRARFEQYLHSDRPLTGRAVQLSVAEMDAIVAAVDYIQTYLMIEESKIRGEQMATEKSQGKKTVSHYLWLNKHLPGVFQKLGIDWDHNEGIVVAHGDKCYSYEHTWKEKGIPFPHGVAMYLLTQCLPYSAEVRQTPNGWVSPFDWIANNYEKFKAILPDIDESDESVLS